MLWTIVGTIFQLSMPWTQNTFFGCKIIKIRFTHYHVQNYSENKSSWTLFLFLGPCVYLVLACLPWPNIDRAGECGSVARDPPEGARGHGPARGREGKGGGKQSHLLCKMSLYYTTIPYTILI